MNIKFRFYRISDLDSVVRWAQDDEVAFWWHESAMSEEDIRSKWEASALRDDENMQIFIVTVEDIDVGVIQTYRLAGYPDQAAEVQIPDASGIDVFIGLPEWRNRGIGAALIRQFVDEIVFADLSIKRCTIDPAPDNRRAIRAYENAGFQYVRSYLSEVNPGNVYLMVKERTSK